MIRMQGATIVQTTVPHTANVAIHVAFGSVALLAGMMAIAVRKGGARHRRAGQAFMVSLAVLIVTAVIGVAAFQFRAFLSVITVLAAYNGYSGWRALRLRASAPARQDTGVALAALTICVLFVAILPRVRLPWAPVVIYSTLGALVASAGYDLVRLTFPARWRARLWLYEHLSKMLAAYSAVASAFAGTVLEAWQPYSQILPSAMATTAMVGFGIYVSRRPQLGVVRPTSGAPRTPEQPVATASLSDGDTLTVARGAHNLTP